ncbi:MAG: hypothetical protein JXA09_18260 [Anaerolineae bacterium]|nr:hypothetical protein [Anaerolineae bacterium]
MRWGRLIGGLLCLVVAVAIYVLPEDKTMFMVGGRDMPLVPAIGLGLLGLVLIVSALLGRRAQS